MNRWNVVTNAVRGSVVGLADRLYGCAHYKTTFPMTLRASASMDGRPPQQPETYIVCLDCGRHFAYDWTTMKVTKRRIAWVAPPALLAPLGEALLEATRGSR
jgi:hypothetical protein